MAAFRTLWTALMSVYEATLVLLLANLAALALNLPFGVALFLIALPFVGSGEDSGAQLLIVAIAWMLPFLPTPGTVALGGLAQAAAGPDVPTFGIFTQTLRARWQLAVRCSIVSVVVLVALAANVYFYAVFAGGWVRFASILWLYGLLVWLSLHVYLVPLLVHVAEPRVFDLYKRAAFVALGHPGFTLLVLVLLLTLGCVSVIFFPLYVLLGPAFMSLVQAHALREIRRRHGDLIELDEEVQRR